MKFFPLQNATDLLKIIITILYNWRTSMNYTSISNCIQETNYRHLFLKALAAACAYNREKPASLLGARFCCLQHNSTAGRNSLFPGASLQSGRNHL